ncbi:MAG: proton-conducting transporter membrane subunit [Bdellovibrio bacteriovorus]
MTWLLATAGLAPLLLAALARWGRLWWTPALAPLPALVAALLVPDGARLEIPWLLLGCVLGLDATGRLFLGFSALLWLAAGVYTAWDPGSRQAAGVGRFRVFFLLAMGGNLWLILGQDLVSFYTGFAVMGIAAYGLVVHAAGPQALRAGRVYLALTLAGELALFAALVLVAHETGSLTPAAADLAGLGDLTFALLVLGLGIKAGLVPLHVWLPLAYPAAPPAAAAVLSGAMSKVALLGWLRYLPLGQVAAPDWGALLILLGLASMALSIPVGLVQSDPRAVLAYSSVGKVGLLVLILGLVLMEPTLAPLGVAAVALYAAHHGLVKGALFLGVGLRAGTGTPRWVLAGLGFLALAMAGAPLTSGAVAKLGIQAPLNTVDWSWLHGLVALGAAGMVLLMLRFLWATWHLQSSAGHPSPWAAMAWWLLVAVVALFPFTLGSAEAWTGNLSAIVAALLLAAPFLLAARVHPSLMRPLVGRVPPGDLLALAGPLGAAAQWLAGSLFGQWLRLLNRVRTQLGRLGPAPPHAHPEAGLTIWATAGALWLGVLALLLITLAWGGSVAGRVAGLIPG